MEEKSIKDLKVIDIIQMPAFENQVELLMKDLHETRKALSVKKKE